MNLVLVEWADAAFMQGWGSKEHAQHHRESNIASVGILVHEDCDRVTIVQSLSDRDDFGDGITIPRVCIKRIRTLRVK